MIVVTGAAGFIGSSFIEFLNKKGVDDILAVEKISDKMPFKNLNGLKFLDLIDWKDFNGLLNHDLGSKITIVHNGANSSTDITIQAAIEDNYKTTRLLADYCTSKGHKLIYASSAGVYGRNQIQKEELQFENPLTPYAFSKWLTDNAIRQLGYFDELGGPVGLRYFNVYGNLKESHKEGQMSPMLRSFLNNTIKNVVGKDDTGKDFDRHSRDFVFIDDVCQVINFFLENPEKSGIFIADEPPSNPTHALKTLSQNFTCANLEKLRAAGYDKDFTSVVDGASKLFKELYPA
jgi:ADP-L-glycero-D-manno-heptose 6-epimerase